MSKYIYPEDGIRIVTEKETPKESVKLDQIKLRISADTSGLEKALSLLSQTMNETSR